MPRQHTKTWRRDPIDVHVGARIRRRRMVLKLTPKELGQRLGLTAKAVQKYEAGERPIAATDLWQMAKSMGVSVEYFVRGLAKPRGSQRLRETEAVARRVVKPLLALPPAVRAGMVRYIRKLAQAGAWQPTR